MENAVGVKEEAMGKTLDVRDMAPKERHPKIFETFNALKAGESFILINDHEPKPLLYQFQAEHDGQFDWWPLEQGPAVWRVMIVRRKEPAPERTVTEYMQSDHRRLDSIFGRFLASVKEKRWDDASGEFREFSLGLKRHIRAEEDILFPVFEEKTGMRDAGPTVVMRMEHKDIHELLDRILKNTDAKEDSRISEDSFTIANLLADHNMKEEHILYPESDSLIEERERREVIKKAQTL